MDDNMERNLSAMDESKFKKPGGIWSVVEVLMFVLFFANTLADSVIVNLLEKSTCLVILNYNLTNCTDPVSPTTEGRLQQTTADLTLARTLINAFIPSLLVLFIGPWSDTNGRRPVMLLSLTGYTISLAMWTALSLVPGLHPSYFLLTSIPIATCACSPGIFLALTCYISDVTPFNKRALRLGFLMACVMGGILASSLTAPILLSLSAESGYTIVFATSTVLLLACLVYTYLLVPESVHIVESERKALFRLDHVKEIFTTFFKPRDGNTKAIVMMIVINLVIYLVTMEGEVAQLYMFTQKVFKWDLVKYSRFVAFGIILSGLSAFVNTWLLGSVFKVADMPVIFVASIFGLVKAIVQSLARSSQLLYVGSVFGALHLLVSPFSRSQLSKIIPPEDLGKVFAFTSFLESTAPLYAAPAYTLVYKATMDSAPFTIFRLSAGFECVSVLLMGTAFMLYRKLPNANYTTLHDEVTPGSSSIQA